MHLQFRNIFTFISWRFFSVANESVVAFKTKPKIGETLKKLDDKNVVITSEIIDAHCQIKLPFERQLSSLPTLDYSGWMSARVTERFIYIMPCYTRQMC